MRCGDGVKFDVPLVMIKANNLLDCSALGFGKGLRDTGETMACCMVETGC